MREPLALGYNFNSNMSYNFRSVPLILFGPSLVDLCRVIWICGRVQDMLIDY